MAYGLSNSHVTDDVTWHWKVKLVTTIRLERNISKTTWAKDFKFVCSFVLRMPSRRTNNFLESGRGLCHATPTIFGSKLTVGYPSDSLASCSALLCLFVVYVMYRFYPTVLSTVALMLQCCVSVSSVCLSVCPSVRNVLWLNGASWSKSYHWHPSYRKSYMKNRLVPK